MKVVSVVISIALGIQIHCLPAHLALLLLHRVLARNLLDFFALDCINARIGHGNGGQSRHRGSRLRRWWDA